MATAMSWWWPGRSRSTRRRRITFAEVQRDTRVGCGTIGADMQLKMLVVAIVFPAVALASPAAAPARSLKRLPLHRRSTSGWIHETAVRRTSSDRAG